MVKNTVNFFVRENKFHPYLTHETLPAEEKVSIIDDHRKTSFYQTFADGSMRIRLCLWDNLEPKVILALCQRYIRKIMTPGGID